MNRKTLLALAALGAFSQCWAVPIVSNVKMEQIEGTKDVRITYDLADNVNTQLWIDVSVMPKATVVNWGTGSLPLTSVEGDVFRMVAPGRDRSLIWHAGADWNGRYTDMAQAIVRAVIPSDRYGICKGRNLVFYDTCQGEYYGSWGKNDKGVIVSVDVDGDKSYAQAYANSWGIRELYAEVLGPGMISFYWRGPSSSYGFLSLLVDGKEVLRAESSSACQREEYKIESPGKHRISWYYSRSSSYSGTGAYVYLDCVEWKQGL